MIFWVKSLNMQKSNFTVLAVYSKQNRISKCGGKHSVQRKICYQNSRWKRKSIFDPLTMACPLKEVRQRTGFAAWGGGPLASRIPSRSQRTRSYVYVLPQYSETVLSIAFRLRINILLYISYITCSFFFHS